MCVCVAHPPPRRPIIYEAISNKCRKKATMEREQERGTGLIIHMGDKLRKNAARETKLAKPFSCKA